MGTVEGFAIRGPSTPSRKWISCTFSLAKHFWSSSSGTMTAPLKILKFAPLRKVWAWSSMDVDSPAQLNGC